MDSFEKELPTPIHKVHKKHVLLLAEAEKTL